MNLLPSNRVVRLALIFYVPMLAGLFFVRAPAALTTEDWAGLARGLAAAGAAGLAVVVGSRFLTRTVGWGRALHAELSAVLGSLTSWEILLLSLLSSFGEEILFRGVMHPRLGLWVTALLFGAFHFPYRRRLIPWTLFALALGLVLGWLTDTYQSLWPAIFLHFFVNYFNLHDLAGEAPRS